MRDDDGRFDHAHSSRGQANPAVTIPADSAPAPKAPNWLPTAWWQAERRHSPLPDHRASARGAARAPRRATLGAPDAGAWSIPKGEYDDGEDPRECALRVRGETGAALPVSELIELGSVRQKGGKIVSAWAAHGEIDAAAVRSNTFTMEWPPRSGRTAEFPEIDRAGWFGVDHARAKLVAAQAAFLDRLLERLR